MPNTFSDIERIVYRALGPRNPARSSLDHDTTVWDRHYAIEAIWTSREIARQGRFREARRMINKLAGRMDGRCPLEFPHPLPMLAAEAGEEIDTLEEEHRRLEILHWHHLPARLDSGWTILPTCEAPGQAPTHTEGVDFYWEGK